MGNYKSFGDVKILPALPAEELCKILKVRFVFNVYIVLIHPCYACQGACVSVRATRIDSFIPNKSID